MGNTTVCSNRVAKTPECDMTIEQACGLAMLHAWTLTKRRSSDEVPDTNSFWAFVEKDAFLCIERCGALFLDVTRYGVDLEVGQFLAKVLGRISDVRVTQGAFANVKTALLFPHEDGSAVHARADLCSMFPPAEAWQF